MRSSCATLAFLLPLCLGDGIVAGFHGIYACSDMHWKGACNWIEIEYAMIESQECIHLHSDRGFGSLGPDKGLAVSIWGAPDCAGTDVLGSQQIAQGVKDLYVKVKMLKRKDMPKELPEACEFKD